MARGYLKWLGLEGFPKGMKINTDQTFSNDIPSHYASYHEASQIMITLWVPQAGITFMVRHGELVRVPYYKKKVTFVVQTIFGRGIYPATQIYGLMNMATRWVLMQSLMISHGRRNVAPGSRQADEIQEQLQDENAQGW